MVKRTRLFISMLALMTLLGCASQQDRAEQRARMKQAVREAIASRQLHIDIRSMVTLRYGSRTVTPDFFLELRGDTLRSYLPYLGQAHQAPMMSPAMGLNFEAPILQFTESRPKANLSCLDIDVKNREDSYHYIIELYDSGEAYIRVNSMHRDPISFDGSIALPTGLEIISYLCPTNKYRR